MKPPAGTNPEPQLDNIQLLLQRRAELARNKAKFALTETDGQLLTTHSTEIRFEDGQTIIEENKDIVNMYRIRSGKVVLSRNGFQFNTIGKGWFIGDCLVLYNSPTYTMPSTMVAQGPVVLDQINLPFVRQLFQVDSILKAKFMRHLVSKYSAIFINILSDLEDPTFRGKATSQSTIENAASLLTAAVSTSDLSREDSTDSLSSDDASGSGSAPATPTSGTSSGSSSGSTTPTQANVKLNFERPATQHHHHHIRKDPRARALQHATYKSYPLNNKGGGVQTLLVKNKKLKVISKSFGFSFKTSIEFTKIQSISKVGDVAATIVYLPHKVANVFFKNYHDREEFIGIVGSLTAQPTTSAVPVSGQALTVDHDPSLPVSQYEEVKLCGGQEHMFKSQQTPIFLKKGDVLFSEGDLFQRVYTLVKGHCDIVQKGKKVCTMEEGAVIGVATLLYLRPCPVTIVVASETADFVFIPAYKLNAMLDTDIVQAGNLYHHAATTLDRQILRAVGFLPNCQRILREARERSDSGSNLSSDSSLSSLHSESSVGSLNEASA